MLKRESIWINIGYLCSIVVFLFIFTNSTCAQSNKQRFYWLNFGFGGGSVGEEGASVNLNAACQFNKNLLSMRIISCGELFGTNLNDYSLLYGRVLTSSTVLVSFGGGLGIVDGSISHGLFSAKEKIEMTIGLPIEAQLFYRPLRILGFGLYGFVNINSKKSFQGCTLSLQIGKLR